MKSLVIVALLFLAVPRLSAEAGIGDIAIGRERNASEEKRTIIYSVAMIFSAALIGGGIYLGLRSVASNGARKNGSPANEEKT